MNTTELINLDDDIDVGSWFHSVVQSFLNQALAKYKKDYTVLTELSIDIGGKEFKPDLSIYPKQKINVFLDNDIIKMDKMPLCAIEVVSPGQSNTLLRAKAKMYLENGIKSAWIVNPELATIQILYQDKTTEVFSYNDVLKDNALNIELKLDSDIFPLD